MKSVSLIFLCLLQFAYIYGQNKADIDTYTKAIESDPENAVAYYSRGVLKSNKAQYKSAIEDYKKALQIKPDYFEALFAAGLDYADLRNEKEAINYFTKALKIKK